MQIIVAVQLSSMLMAIACIMCVNIAKSKMLDLIANTELECRTKDGVVPEDKIPFEIRSMSNSLLELCSTQTEMLAAKIKFYIVAVASIINIICFIYS